MTSRREFLRAGSIFAAIAVAAFVSAPALLLVDPLVIVVLDNELEEWVCVAETST